MSKCYSPRHRWWQDINYYRAINITLFLGTNINRIQNYLQGQFQRAALSTFRLESTKQMCLPLNKLPAIMQWHVYYFCFCLCLAEIC